MQMILLPQSKPGAQKNLKESKRDLKRGLSINRITRVIFDVCKVRDYSTYRQEKNASFLHLDRTGKK